MAVGKLPRITNIWSRIVNEAGGGWETQVVIEADTPFTYTLPNSTGPAVLRIDTGARAVMPEGAIPVYDGLLKTVTLQQIDAGTARIILEREHPGPYAVAMCNTLPARLIIRLDRAPLAAILSAKKVMIDPGHGGTDRGHRGPVNLWEKDVVLITAEKLAELLGGAGAEILYTRSGDTGMDGPVRIRRAREYGVDLFVSLHTGFSPQTWVGGNRVLYNPNEPRSPFLAELVRDALREQVSLKCKALRPDPAYLGRLGGIPGIAVETVTISNWVEEGLLRMPRFHEKTALGIFNGILRWLVK
ncbi:MAG: N-acetylmuramoyl-L-alanine amidase family protein [Desulfotomaculales bacterium]